MLSHNTSVAQRAWRQYSLILTKAGLVYNKVWSIPVWKMRPRWYTLYRCIQCIVNEDHFRSKPCISSLLKCISDWSLSKRDSEVYLLHRINNLCDVSPDRVKKSICWQKSDIDKGTYSHVVFQQGYLVWFHFVFSERIFLWEWCFGVLEVRIWAENNGSQMTFLFFFPCILIFVFWKFLLQLVQLGSCDNELALVQIMAGHRTYDNPLSESMEAMFTDAYMCISRPGWVLKKRYIHRVIWVWVDTGAWNVRLCQVPLPRPFSSHRPLTSGRPLAHRFRFTRFRFTRFILRHKLSGYFRTLLYSQQCWRFG